MAVHPVPVHIITAQPGVFRSPVELKTESWSSSLFNCGEDTGICCLGFWCPCCLACQISSDFGECLCMPLVDMLAGGMVPAASMALRSAMRERYRIQGSMLDDCCIVTFCSSCAWCQMAREIKQRKRPLLLNTAPSATVDIRMSLPPNVPAYAPQSMHPIPTGLYPHKP